jgi:hypothetical protein
MVKPAGSMPRESQNVKGWCGRSLGPEAEALGLRARAMWLVD